MKRHRGANPFAITKAVDLNDEQIENLWVQMMGDGDDLEELDHPASPMPTLLLGAKGSGKTHMMRHQAYELQKLRYKRRGDTVRDGIFNDGYIGLYVRCSGLQASRFSGKRQSSELWDELFSYYFELWLAQHLLNVAVDLQLSSDANEEGRVVEGILRLFDRHIVLPQPTLTAVIEALETAQRKLDYEINNCLLRNRLDVEILATRGKLIFGIPKLLSATYSFLRDVLFAYDIDEFENLTESQQIHVNTLVREKEAPTTFRIGSRTYGVRTFRTNSAGEENQRDSEFRQISIDTQFRQMKAQYSTFSRALIAKRLVSAYSAVIDENGGEFLENYFDRFDQKWNNPQWLHYMQESDDGRPHFKRLRKLLRADGASEAIVDTVIGKIQCDEFPLIEKLNIYLLFQELSDGVAVLEAASDIHSRFHRFLRNEESSGSYRQSMQHHGDDLAAQLLRENGRSQIYCGVDTFIQMSAGIPRALLTILRSVFEWAVFNDERPFEGGVISLESQRRGVIAASDWYFNNMRKAGEEGILIQSAIERLANILRTMRFGDKPTELSPSSFSVAEQDISVSARRVLHLAEARAFVHRVEGGQRDKNSQKMTSKFQLSPMLAPRWDLPLVRRTIMPLGADEFNAIFDSDLDDQYTATLRKFRNRVDYPFRGTFETQGQIGLFD